MGARLKPEPDFSKEDLYWLLLTAAVQPSVSPLTDSIAFDSSFCLASLGTSMVVANKIAQYETSSFRNGQVSIGILQKAGCDKRLNIFFNRSLEMRGEVADILTEAL